MRSVYVNLDRATDRRAWMERQAEIARIEIERVPAVDGRSLTADEIAAVTTNSRLSKGAIGCFLTHRRIWKDMLESSRSHLAIFEDDARISPSASLFLADAAWIPADADIVRLEKKQSRPVASVASIPTLDDRELRRLYGKDAGTAGYIISWDCAAILSACLTQLTAEFDQMLFNRRSPICRSLRIYKLYPSLCIQDQETFPGSIDRAKLLPRFIENAMIGAQRCLDRLRAPEPTRRYAAEFR
ncbi:MAG: glycosyltransferase family 25 protein [Rhizobiales bacterium]|nr:glycosyltransferase family 25 protein [Hyphomicrobiales bacterium]